MFNICHIAWQGHFKKETSLQGVPSINIEGHYVCKKCEKQFTMKNSLERHMKLYTGQYGFYCDKCKKGIRDKSDYVEHMRAHQGLK